MDKILTLLRRSPALEAEAFRAEWLRELKRLLADDPRLRRCIVNFVDPEASSLLEAGRPPPAYEGALETWWQPSGKLEPLLAGLAQAAGPRFSYRVYEVVQKEYAPSWPLGERSPGIKGIYTVDRRSDMTREGFAKHWHEGHGPLAVKHHIGLIKYVQNVNAGTLTRDAPEFDGFATLHFPTAADMRDRFYDSAEGRKLIGEDVKRFVGSPSSQMNCSEYVLRR
jgi:uncharacterized protein (TIGR02118 family)